MRNPAFVTIPMQVIPIAFILILQTHLLQRGRLSQPSVLAVVAYYVISNCNWYYP
jgi:hypothetical protein